MIFPLVKQARKSRCVGQELGEELIAATDYIGYIVVKGFLNLSLKNDFYQSGSKFRPILTFRKGHYGRIFLPEYKQTHLGHVRNLLGYSVAESCRLQCIKRLSMTVVFIFVNPCWRGEIREW